ncbi:MAG: hypothetical protein ABL907_19545, partial [Hyphomicrobium sp.]
MDLFPMLSSNRRVSITLGFSAILAAGCAHVPVATMYKLWSFNALTADPAAIRAAIRVPAVLEPRPRGAKLTLTSTPEGASAPNVSTFLLEEVTEPHELQRLARYERRGYPVRAF